MNSEIKRLEQRIKELEAIEQDYKRLEDLLDYAAKGGNLEKYAGDVLLYAEPETGKIIDANALALDFLGYSLAEIQQLTIAELETKPNASIILRESAQDIEIYEASYRHLDGFQLPVKVRKRLTEKTGGKLLFYALEDKSLRKQTWRELSRREDSDFQFREKLKTLNEINLELGRIENFDALCRRSIELGRERLGLDRLSIWFLDASKGQMLGSFGVDEEGMIRDERGQSWSYGGGYVEEFIAGKREPIITQDDAPLYNERSEFIGYGWHMSVPLLDGAEFIGFMGVDNFINKQAIKPYQPELLRLFGANIGHLAARQRERETIRKLSIAVQESASMILILDRQHRIEFANHAFMKRTQYQKEEVLGQAAAQILPDVLIVESLGNQQEWRGEICIDKADGKSFEALASIALIYQSEAPEHYVVVLEDISALKRQKQHELELKLEQERIRLLASFVSDIAHEFNTPLSIIKTANYFLRRDIEENKRQNYAASIDDSVLYLNHLFRAMMDIVRLDSENKINASEIRLAGFLQDIVRNINHDNEAKPLEWEMDFQSEGIMHADSQKLWRALQEIILNAIEYTPANGKLAIHLRESESHYHILVEDTGIGIASEEQEKIFHRFYRVDSARSHRHAGLGLAIAKRIIELHGGEIRLESRPNEGSRFEVRLPKSV